MKQFLEIKKEQKLDLKQTLALSQQMKLSINILEMSIEKLNNYLEDEITSNPNIEVKFFSKEKYFYGDEDFSELENISQEKKFFEELEEQINYLNLDAKRRENCIFIINNLNQKGYLEISKKELLKLLKINEDELENILEIIHSLEPYGVGAFSLEDCLKIQLKQKKIFDEKLYNLIDKYLMLIAEQKYELIKEKLNIEDSKLEEYIKEIKKLNPIPTRGYNVGKIRRIIPEILVEKNGEDFVCRLNETVIPKISVRNEDELEKNLYKKINDLILAVEKRYITLLKISKVLVKKQRVFFESKGQNLNTLKIIDIAEELNLSPSTISRAIREKYLLTDFGTIALKKFICINSEALHEKACIENYIKNEDRKKPYSDQELMNLLNKDGFKIARRTVSKYRKELGYKSSSARKV